MPGQLPNSGIALRSAVPCNQLVAAANALLQDPNAREAIRRMHAEGTPLLTMLDVLGLEEDLTPRIREILETLPAHVIEDVRRATLAMLDTTAFELPLDCAATDADLDGGVPIEVEIVRQDRRPTIRVRVRPAE